MRTTRSRRSTRFVVLAIVLGTFAPLTLLAASGRIDSSMFLLLTTMLGVLPLLALPDSHNSSCRRAAEHARSVN